MKLKNLTPLFVFFIFCSCAASYHSIDPEKITYSSFSGIDSLEFWYKYDVLRSHGNNRYAKKAMKRGIQVVGVKIVNHSSKTLNFSRDLRVNTSWGNIRPLDPYSATTELKQPW